MAGGRAAMLLAALKICQLPGRSYALQMDVILI